MILQNGCFLNGRSRFLFLQPVHNALAALLMGFFNSPFGWCGKHQFICLLRQVDKLFFKISVSSNGIRILTNQKLRHISSL